MDLSPYVDNLRQELAVAAESGGEEARALAERLVAPLESAVRLTLLEALSAAADEITRDLAPGSVELRLRGREPGFVVTAPLDDRAFEDLDEAEGPSRAPGASAPSAGEGEVPPPGAPPADEGAASRINFRLPESLKSRIEVAAGHAGLSVNSWLVRAVSAALEPGRGASPGSGAGSSSGGGRRSGRRGSWGGQYTGWVR